MIFVKKVEVPKLLIRNNIYHRGKEIIIKQSYDLEAILKKFF